MTVQSSTSTSGGMHDWRLQLAFCHLKRGDFGQAAAVIDALDAGGGNTEWKALMEKVLELEQDTAQGLHLAGSDPSYLDFFGPYASSSNMDGKFIAQSLLSLVHDSVYPDPHALPEGISGSRSGITGLENQKKALTLKVVPNPTNADVTIFYSGDKIARTIQVYDLLGKTVYSQTPDAAEFEHSVPLSNFSSGVYILRILCADGENYQSKIIKQE